MAIVNETGPRGAALGRSSAASGQEVVTEWNRFLSLREPWERLRERVPGFTLYQSHAWLRTWWEHLAGQRRLFVPCVWQGERLVAAAPLCTQPGWLGPLPTRTLQFIAAEQGDFGRMLIDPEHDGEALWNLIAAGRRGAWNVADLRYVPEDGFGGSAAVPVPGIRHLLQAQECNRWVKFAGRPWRECVKKPMRHNVERQLRRLQAEGPVAFERADSLPAARSLLAELVQLHIAQWAARGETSVYSLPGHPAWADAAVCRLLEEGSLYLCRLHRDGQTIIAGWAFLERGHLLLYQYAYDAQFAAYSPAGLLMAAIMDDMEANGLGGLFDFGRGDEDYKSRWTDNSRMLTRHLLVPAGIHGRLYDVLAGRVMPYVWRNRKLGRLVRETKRRLARVPGSKQKPEVMK